MRYRTFLVALLCCQMLTAQTPKPTKTATARPSSTNQPEGVRTPKTFGQFKQRFLGQEVVINDTPFQKSYCLQWTKAQKKGGNSYKEDFPNDLPLKYRGQTARVIAIELAHTSIQQTQVGGKNAFGETIGENDISDPYMSVVVEFEDGVIGITSGYPITLVPELMELASTKESEKETILSQLPNIIGQQLYAVGYSRLYKPTSTLTEITGPYEMLARKSVLDVPLLEPLTIIKDKYVTETGGVLFELKLPDGSQAIGYTSPEYMDFSGSKNDFLARVSGTLLASFPKDLPQREIEAIRKRELYRGMSGDAVNFALGLPDKENDWGEGGKQRIYFDGKLIVYLNTEGKVVDWQNFD